MLKRILWNVANVKQTIIVPKNAKRKTGKFIDWNAKFLKKLKKKISRWLILLSFL